MQLQHTTRRGRALAALAAFLSACGGTGERFEPPTVTTVAVRTGAPTVAPGDSVVVIAEPRDAAGNAVRGVPVAWAWSDSLYVTGTADGATLRLRVTRPDTLRVTARAGGAAGTLLLPVRYGTPVAVRLVLAPGDSLVVGGAAGVSAYAVDSLGRAVPDRPPEVTVSDTAVARVRQSSAGLVLEARRPGRAEVVAAVGAVRAVASVRVWPAPRYVWPDTSALWPGDARALRAQERPDDARPTVLAADRWLTSDPGVATVSAAGVVTGVAPGRAAVRAVVGGDTLPPAVVFVKAPPPPIEFVAIASGAPCAVSRDGGVWCWGGDGALLGTAEPVDRCESFQPWSGGGRQWYERSVTRCSALPVRVRSASRFVAAAGHGLGVCGLTDAAAVECWGTVPSPARRSAVPVPVAPGLRVAAIDGRCLLTVDGAVHCWGGWTVPIWGDGVRTSAETFERVPSPVAFRRIAAAGYHLCAVTAEGAVHCLGSNFAGEVGVGGSVRAPGCFIACEPAFRVVAGLPPARDVRLGPAISCALDDAGAVRCWGVTGEGPSGTSPTPRPVEGAPPLAALVPWSQGDGAECGVTAGGEVWCWGRPPRRAERAAHPAFPVRAATVGPVFGCAIARADGRLTCWGQGWLGDGVPAERAVFRVARVAGQAP